MISVDSILSDLHDLSKLEDLCRLCGKTQPTIVPIFDETHRYNYYKIILQHFKDEIQVSKADILPLKMCSKCLKSMMSWHEFYLDCLKVEKKFKRLMDKFSLNHDSNKPTSTVGNDVEVIEVSVDCDNLDFYNETTNVFDISNINIKESSSLANTDDFTDFHDVEDINDSDAENKTSDNSLNHSEIVVEISDKMMESGLENIKVEESGCISQESEIVKIELIEPFDIPVEPKPEQNESIDTDSCSLVESPSVISEPTNSIEPIPNDVEPSKSETSLPSDAVTAKKPRKNNSWNDISVPLALKPKRTPRRASRICHLCGKHYNTESGFRHHLIMHQDPSYSCHECGHVFYEAQNLKKHLAAIHSDERPFQCHLCGNKYKRKDVLQEHIKRVHDGIKRVWNIESLKKYRKKQQTQKKYKYTCPYCNKILGTKGYLNDHINGVHTKEKLYKCNECDMSFTRKTTFKYHFKRAHILNKTVLEPRGTFLKDCEYCGLQFQIKKYYDQHITAKHLHTFKCTFCEGIFDSKLQLTEHVDTVHADKIFRCDQCQKGFAEELLLKRHVYICHTNRKPYECHECGYKANKKATLAVHIRRHTGEKPYQCDMCHRRFTQSVDYRKHRANHFKKI